MEIDNFGKVLKPKQNNDKKQKKLDKLIKNYIDGFCKIIESGKLELPSGGDCWYCCMKTEQGDTLADASGNLSHLLHHFRDKYYVPSLLYHAIKEQGYVSPELIYTLAKGSNEHKPEIYNAKMALKAYFRKRYHKLLKAAQ